MRNRAVIVTDPDRAYFVEDQMYRMPSKRIWSLVRSVTDPRATVMVWEDLRKI